MGRLTEYTNINGDPAIYCVGKKVPYWKWLYQPLKKLAHYEDLEEQGRLIELDKQHCDWCDKGAELCGTCRKFFDYHNDGGSDKCSAECKEGACLNYEPMNYCPNCGIKLKELKEGVE